jgi:hypothetical protein
VGAANPTGVTYPTLAYHIRRQGIHSWQCGDREDAQDEDEFGNLLVR